MKILIAIMLVFSLVHAKREIVSLIPAANSVFIDTDPVACDITCMEKLLENSQIFTFVSKFDANAAEFAKLRSEFGYYRRIFRIFQEEDLAIKVAILVPQVSIRRYAISTVNSVIAYLLSKQNNFEIRVFNSMNEEKASILRQLETIKNQNFTYVIAPVTQKGAQIIIENRENLLVYIPTIHQSSTNFKDSNILFGGIDYERQIDELIKISNGRIVYFSDSSQLTQSLNQALIEKTPKIVANYTIDNANMNFKQILKNNTKINNTSVFLNTPLVQTSLIASQLRVYDIEPFVLLSTQINYNSVLLNLTQYDDRKNLYIANSIGKTSTQLVEMNALFEHDITYDWVNYATSVGIDYLYTHFFATSESSSFEENMLDNQVNYNISILKPTRYRFEQELFLSN